MDRRILSLLVTTTALLPLAVDAAGARAAGCPGAGRPPSGAQRSELSRAMRCLVNRERARHGLHAVHGSSHLKAAAHGHAMSMVRQRYFAHTGPGGSSPAQRARAAGYLRPGRWLLGEDIAYGTHRLATPRAIFAAFMASPEHRHVLLTRGYRRIGIGIARGTPSTGRTRSGATYVLDLGARS